MRVRRADDGGRSAACGGSSSTATTTSSSSTSPRPASRVEHPVFLVCTHGKHDRCCAKYGRPLYDAVREQVDEEWVWQSTHVGGDRFAGNLVALPDGVYYGRVEPSDVWPLLESALAGRDLPAALPRAARATRSPCRRPSGRCARQTGLLGVGDVRLAGGARTERGWRVRLSAAGVDYEVDVCREDGEPTHLTCSAVELRRPKRFVAESPPARVA